MPEKPIIKYVTAYSGLTPRIDLKAHSLLFTHIPKTAGTTFEHILYALAISSQTPYPRAMGTVYGQFHGFGKDEAMQEFNRIPEKYMHKRTFLSGHLPHGIHRVLSRPYFYITLLRDPAARLLSQYRFGMQCGGWNETSSVAGVIEKGLIVDNVQTRMLAGMRDRSNPCTADTLKTAIEHLRSEYTVVGIAERFDAMLKLVITLLGWPDVAYGNRQVSEGDAHPDHMEQASAAVPCYFAYDLELYAVARELAEQNAARVLAGNPKALERQSQVITSIAGSSVEGTKHALMSAQRFDEAFLPVLKAHNYEVSFV